MTDQSLAARQQLSAAAETEAKNLSTVEDMIAEEQLFQANARAAIRAARDAIANQQEAIRQSKQRETTLRRRRRIFSRAAFELREVDSI